MNLSDAGKFKVDFGKHKGGTIDQIAQTDEGLRYLDWLRGSDMCKIRDGRLPELRQALDIYLGAPAIRQELDRVLGD